jgi:hypothetical protein
MLMLCMLFVVQAFLADQLFVIAAIFDDIFITMVITLDLDALFDLFFKTSTDAERHGNINTWWGILVTLFDGALEFVFFNNLFVIALDHFMDTLLARCVSTAKQRNGQSILEIVVGVASLYRASEAGVHNFIYLYIL